MIGGSLNISLSNNPVFSGGHFVRVEPLLVICLSGFRCNLQNLTPFCQFFFRWAHLYCKICFRLSQMLALEGQSLKYFREHVGYYDDNVELDEPSAEGLISELWPE